MKKIVEVEPPYIAEFFESHAPLLKGSAVPIQSSFEMNTVGNTGWSAGAMGDVSSSRPTNAATLAWLESAAVHAANSTGSSGEFSVFENCRGCYLQVGNAKYLLPETLQRFDVRNFSFSYRVSLYSTSAGFIGKTWESATFPVHSRSGNEITLSNPVSAYFCIPGSEPVEAVVEGVVTVTHEDSGLLGKFGLGFTRIPVAETMKRFPSTADSMAPEGVAATVLEGSPRQLLTLAGLVNLPLKLRTPNTATNTMPPPSPGATLQIILQEHSDLRAAAPLFGVNRVIGPEDFLPGLQLSPQRNPLIPCLAASDLSFQPGQPPRPLFPSIAPAACLSLRRLNISISEAYERALHTTLSRAVEIMSGAGPGVLANRIVVQQRFMEVGLHNTVRFVAPVLRCPLEPLGPGAKTGETLYQMRETQWDLPAFPVDPWVAFVFRLVYQVRYPSMYGGGAGMPPQQAQSPQSPQSPFSPQGPPAGVGADGLKELVVGLHIYLPFDGSEMRLTNKPSGRVSWARTDCRLELPLEAPLARLHDSKFLWLTRDEMMPEEAMVEAAGLAMGSTRPALGIDVELKDVSRYGGVESVRVPVQLSVTGGPAAPLPWSPPPRTDIPTLSRGMQARIAEEEEWYRSHFMRRAQEPQRPAVSVDNAIAQEKQEVVQQQRRDQAAKDIDGLSVAATDISESVDLEGRWRPRQGAFGTAQYKVDVLKAHRDSDPEVASPGSPLSQDLSGLDEEDEDFPEDLGTRSFTKRRGKVPKFIEFDDDEVASVMTRESESMQRNVPKLPPIVPPSAAPSPRPIPPTSATAPAAAAAPASIPGAGATPRVPMATAVGMPHPDELRPAMSGLPPSAVNLPGPKQSYALGWSWAPSRGLPLSRAHRTLLSQHGFLDVMAETPGYGEPQPAGYHLERGVSQSAGDGPAVQLDLELSDPLKANKVSIQFASFVPTRHRYLDPVSGKVMANTGSRDFGQPMDAQGGRGMLDDSNSPPLQQARDSHLPQALFFTFQLYTMAPTRTAPMELQRMDTDERSSSEYLRQSGQLQESSAMDKAIYLLTQQQMYQDPHYRSGASRTSSQPNVFIIDPSVLGPEESRRFASYMATKALHVEVSSEGRSL